MTPEAGHRRGDIFEAHSNQTLPCLVTIDRCPVWPVPDREAPVTARIFASDLKRYRRPEVPTTFFPMNMKPMHLDAAPEDC